MNAKPSDAARWVEEKNAATNFNYGKRKDYRRRPETLSEFQAKVIEICDMVAGGIHNAPINWGKVSWGSAAPHSGMFVPWRDGRMATADTCQLTRLVLLCHQARIRCEISARSRGHLELSFFQRGHEGGTGQRCPSVEEAVAAHRLPRNHHLVYRVPAPRIAA